MYMMTTTNETAQMVQNYDLEGAHSTLSRGGLLLFPTDTLWSIGCDATNPGAIDKLLQVKPSKASTPLEILVDSVQMLKQYVDHLHPRIETLLYYHVRPLTVVCKKARNLPSNLLPPDGRVAIRMVQDDFCRELIQSFGAPLVATYATLNEQYFPSTFGGVSSEVIQAVDYVALHRRTEKTPGEPSVIVSLSEKDELIFLRE